MAKEAKVNREDLFNSLNNHVLWIEKTINKIVQAEDVKLTSDVIKVLAELAQAKSTALLALSNLA